MADAALNFYAGMGPAIVNDVKAYAHTGGVALVDPGGGADPYIEIDDTAGSVPLGTTREPLSADTSHLAMFFVYMPTGTVDSAETVTFLQVVGVGTSSTMNLIAVQSSGSNFNIRVSIGAITVLTTLAEYAVDTWLTFLVELDGTHWRLYEWTGSVWLHVGTGVRSEKLNTSGSQVVIQGTGASLDAGEKYRLKLLLLCGTDTRAAAPNSSLDVIASFTDGNGTHGDYGDQSDCTAGSTTGDEARWDDWATGANDGDTTDNCEDGGSNGTMTSTMANTTVPTGFFGVQVRAFGKANLAAKTVDVWLRIDDGTNDQEQADAFPGDTYVTKTAGFTLAPDGSTVWSQTEWNGTEIGVRSVSTNGANDIWTAIGAELFGVGTQALPVIPQPAGVALGSANAGIF